MQLLTITLPCPLHPGNIPAFRSAIIELVGQEQHLFHNHDNRQPGADHHHYGYPLIQYQVRRGMATILGLNEGVQAIEQYLLPRLRPELEFAGQTHTLEGYHLHPHEYALQLSERPQVFGLQGWLALNTENYSRWKATEDEVERKKILSSALTGHLRSLMETLGTVAWRSLVEARVLQVDQQKCIQWHGTELVRFDVLAESNLRFPAGIGIGRVAAFGFGEVMSEKAYARYREWASRNLSVELEGEE